MCNDVSPVPPEWIEERYGNYHNLVKVSAWILRFVSNLKMKLSQCPLTLAASLSPSELKLSEHHLFARAQDRHFREDRQRLSTSKLIRASSTVSSLNPFIGDGGLLVVGGCLSNSQLSFSQQHPPILSSKDHLTSLLFLSLHLTLPLWPSLVYVPCRYPSPCDRSSKTGKDCVQILRGLQESCCSNRNSANETTPSTSGVTKPSISRDWSRLCWSLLDEVGTLPKAHCYRNVSLCICVFFHKGCTQ